MKSCNQFSISSALTDSYKAAASLACFSYQIYDLDLIIRIHLAFMMQEDWISNVAVALKQALKACLSDHIFDE